MWRGNSVQADGNTGDGRSALKEGALVSLYRIHGFAFVAKIDIKKVFGIGGLNRE